MLDVTLVDAVPRRTAVIRGRMQPQDLPVFLAHAFDAVAAAVAKQGAHVTGPPVTVYRTLSGAEFEVEAGFPVAAAITADGAVVPGELPGGRTVEAVHIGPYATLPSTYGEIETWLRQHGFRSAPPMWESYLTDPADPAHRHEDGPRTLIVQPVEDAAPGSGAGASPGDTVEQHRGGGHRRTTGPTAGSRRRDL